MNRRSLWIVGVAVLLVGILAWDSLFTVHQTRQALVLQFGDPRRAIKTPGLHFKLPFIQNVEYFDKRILSYDGEAEEIIALDQKRLVVDSFVRFRITDPLKFFQSVGDENIARSRIAAMLNSSLARGAGRGAAGLGADGRARRPDDRYRRAGERRGRGARRHRHRRAHQARRPAGSQQPGDLRAHEDRA